MELAELSAVGLTFLLKLLVIRARHHGHQMQGTNYCSDMMDGCSFMFGCPAERGPRAEGLATKEGGLSRGAKKPTIAR